MIKTIFVVDDDYKIRTLLTTYLEKNNFQVKSAADGETFLQEFENEAFSIDLVILDIMLPGADGFLICKQLRERSDVPVIMLTANDDDTDRVVGLEIGADDYLAKPFNPRELLARIKAILRRVESNTAPVTGGRFYSFKGYRLDSVERHLTSPKGSSIKLSGADFQLLVLLLNHPGEILHRDFLAEKTRQRSAGPLDRYLDVQISRLRSRFSELPDLIKTVRGSGYVFSAEVQRSGTPSLAS